MPEVKINSDNNFYSFASKVKNCSVLNSSERLILFTFYSYKNKKIHSNFPEILISDTSLPPSEIKKSLYCLTRRGWLQIDNNYCIIKEPDVLEKGQKIARMWSDIFGAIQLTPYTFDKILTYINDGLEEELILEVLKVSAKNAQGNPLNYSYAIFSSLLEKEIYKLEDYYEYNIERGEGTGKQISSGTKKSKKRMEKQTLTELYKKGYQ